VASATQRRTSRATKTDHVGMAVYDVAVSRSERITPHLVRVTFGAEELRGFRDDGPDQRFKLMLPRPGQTQPILPDRQDWYASWLAMPAATRPVLRTYTVRTARPDQAEMDVDFVLHDPAGPASRWAANARPGDRVGLCAAWAEYEVPPQTQRQLIVGDHTALPAISAICERMTAGTRADVVIEVPGAADQLPIRTPVDPPVRWLHREPGRPGTALLEAVLALPAEPTWEYAWVAADRETVAAIRRHLVTHRGLAPTSIMFMGYWRTDGAIDDD
jgi:NADPH-dependent ferric siderophore reductase